jgi:YNFM family putative membrane transporter
MAGATERDRGLASALYFSAYYLAGALGGYLPGLAFERWEWPGVAALALGAYAIGACAVGFLRRE